MYLHVLPSLIPPLPPLQPFPFHPISRRSSFSFPPSPSRPLSLCSNDPSPASPPLTLPYPTLLYLLYSTLRAILLALGLACSALSAHPTSSRPLPPSPPERPISDTRRQFPNGQLFSRADRKCDDCCWSCSCSRSRSRSSSCSCNCAHAHTRTEYCPSTQTPKYRIIELLTYPTSTHLPN